MIIHNNRWSQYTGSTYIEFLQSHRFIINHSRPGTPYDNAVMGSFYKSFKREVLKKKALSSKSQATMEILHYLEIYYNKKRHHSSLKYMAPFEYETQAIWKLLNSLIFCLVLCWHLFFSYYKSKNTVNMVILDFSTLKIL